MSDAPLDLANDPGWTPALRRAIMRVRPEFFAWPPSERDRYRLDVPDADAAEIDRRLQKELLGFVEARDELDDTQLTCLNAAILPLHGVGEDCFYLNESLDDGVTILDFATVRDYDHADYLFQEQCRQKDFPHLAGKPYRGSLYFVWARLFVDGQFTYANLSMAAGYLLSHVEEQAQETIDALIPHRYVPGKDHGRREGDGYTWDMRIDADGKEGLIEELRDLCYAYERRRHDELAEVWDQDAATGVFVRDRDIPGETNKDFIFTDQTALEAVRFRSFLRDCRAIECSADELDAHVRHENSNFDSHIRAEYERLAKEFDPAVVKLRKKRKIILRKSAADKLL
jgi:hypothetical protein